VLNKPLERQVPKRMAEGRKSRKFQNSGAKLHSGIKAAAEVWRKKDEDGGEVSRGGSENLFRLRSLQNEERIRN